MKTKLTILSILLTISTYAQIQFERVPSPPPPAPQIIADFCRVAYSSIAFADIDGDNDQDVLITGSGVAKLYTNDGLGNFTEVTGTPFAGVRYGSIAFADIDGDNDQDVLITGENHNNRIAKLYTNDGLGNFTEVTGTPFTGVSGGSIAFADIDGDNDQDVLITGLGIAKLYTNDGSGNFTEVTSTPFTGVFSASIAFADIDGDNDQDVLITGSYYDSSHDIQYISKLYTNDGLGNFTEVTGTPFEGVYRGSIAFADIDGDNDQDVLITGIYYDGSYHKISKLYSNDGSGNFTEVTGTPFTGVEYGSIAFADIDGDNDKDLLITGSSSNGRIAKLYTNDGSGNFTEVNKTPFTGVKFSSIAFADIDGDNDQDVLITGSRIAKLYTNDGSGNFIEVTGTPFTGVSQSSIAFADIDGDNDQDVLITGSELAELYTNDGSGNFTQTGTPFTGVVGSSIAFADIDGDNDQDVLITGIYYDGSYHKISKLYSNDGSGNFTEVTGTPFTGVEYGSIAFADIDGDNDKDLLITGSSSNGRIAKLYTNDGLGNFTEVIGTPFEGVDRGSIAFADIDGDNDQDVLITGSGIAKLYTNDGSGNFTEVTGTPFEGVYRGSIAFADIDSDNDQDILITGDSSNGKISKLYTNDGIGNFVEVTGTPFLGVMYSSIAFADIDGDNDKDVLITGYNRCLVDISFLYRNTTNQAGIQEFSSQNVNIFPNPGKHSFFIDTQDNKTINDISVYNLQGQEVPFTYHKEQHKIDVNLPKGIYIVSFTVDKVKKSQKIVVE